MKNIFILIISLILCACHSTKKIIIQPEDEIVEIAESYKTFNVEIIQNGKVIDEVNNIIYLEPAPFKYRLTYYDTDEILVSNSLNRHFYDFSDFENALDCDPNKIKDIEKECQYHGWKTFAEDNFNEEKNILLSDYAHSNWFYSPELNWYRMDKNISNKNGIITATVTVEYITNIDERDANDEAITVPIEKFDKDIYVTLSAGDMKEQIEYQREKFILRFNKK